MPFPKIPGLAVFGVTQKPSADIAPAPPCFDTPPAAATQHEGDNVCTSTGSKNSATFQADAPGAAQHEGSPRKFSLPAPVPAGWRGFDAAKVRKLHALYYDPALTVVEVAKVFDVATSTLLRWIAELQWPSRRQLRRRSVAVLRGEGAGIRAVSGRASFAAPHDVAVPEAFAPAPETSAAPAPAAGSAAAGAMLRSVEDTVRREIAMMGARMQDTSAGAGERNARTLASLVRTLRAVSELRGKAEGFEPQAANGDKPPRSLAQLRAELAERLDRIQADRDANGDAGNGSAAGGVMD
ncbi:MAG: hypothetical protein AB7F96_21670 [Beijerinckiaceae bacterium]